MARRRQKQRGDNDVLATLVRLGWTQEQLADALSTKEQRLDPRTIRRWLAGERRPPPYLALALETIERREMERREMAT